MVRSYTTYVSCRYCLFWFLQAAENAWMWFVIQQRKLSKAQPYFVIGAIPSIPKLGLGIIQVGVGAAHWAVAPFAVMRWELGGSSRDPEVQDRTTRWWSIGALWMIGGWTSIAYAVANIGTLGLCAMCIEKFVGDN